MLLQNEVVCAAPRSGEYGHTVLLLSMGGPDVEPAPLAQGRRAEGQGLGHDARRGVQNATRICRGRGAELVKRLSPLYRSGFRTGEIDLEQRNTSRGLTSV